MLATVRYKIISPYAKVPTKATTSSACYDVTSAEDVDIYVGDTTAVHTGLILQPQYNHYIDVRPRSGMSKVGISIANAPGTIDSDYGNEFMVLLYNHSKKDYHISVGHRICQIGIMPVTDIRFVESVNLIDRHGKGFGSTGK